MASRVCNARVESPSARFLGLALGTYYFVGEEGDAAATLRGLDQEPVGSITLREKRGRREILEHVLAELQAATRPDRRSLADAYYLLGQANYYEDEKSAAGAYFEKALPLFRKLGDRLGEANALLSMGRLARATGDETRMTASLRQVELIYESIGLKDWARQARELGRAAR